MTAGDDGFDVVTGADSLADTDGPATGETALSRWIIDHRDTLGRGYANELTRHFR